MTYETAKTLFSCPWSRDATGYRVIDSIEGVRELWRRWEREQAPGKIDRASGRRVREVRDPWPKHWPHPSLQSGWLERWAAKAEVPGGGLIWPASDEAADECDVIHDGRKHLDGRPYDVLLEFLNCGADADEDTGEILEFTNRYGLLWADRPLSLEDFRYCRDELRPFTEPDEVSADDEPDEVSADDLAALEKWSPTAIMKWRRGATSQEGASQPQARFELGSLFDAIVFLLGQSFASDRIDWRQCPECAKVFTAGPGGSRSSKAIQCRPECTKAHNDRVQNAKRAAKRRQEKEAKRTQHAAELCPYCPEGDERPKQNLHHCNRTNCRKRHSRAAV